MTSPHVAHEGKGRAMTAPPREPVATADILKALYGHYRKPGADRDGEILIPEASAPGSQRRADLVRIGLWASRGPGIDVHEVKASRSDWLRELDDKEKAEAWWPYCHRFWLVAPPGIVHDGELPPGWGLMELPSAGRRFKVRERPETRKDIRLTVPLMVELLRRSDNQRVGEIIALKSAHRDEMYKLETGLRTEKARQDLPFEVQERLRLLEKLEEAAGIRLTTWVSRRMHASGVTDVTPEELGAVLADAAQNISAQRRLWEADRAEQRVRTAAEQALAILTRTRSAA